MDMMTLALAKKYTDEKVSSGGGSGSGGGIEVINLDDYDVDIYDYICESTNGTNLKAYGSAGWDNLSNVGEAVASAFNAGRTVIFAFYFSASASSKIAYCPMEHCTFDSDGNICTASLSITWLSGANANSVNNSGVVFNFKAGTFCVISNHIVNFEVD
jgi:hypothetical protein